jgi:hypothetical protein
MNDTIRTKADFETVDTVVTAVHRKHRKAALASGLSFLEFLANKELTDAMMRDEEIACVLLGWTSKEFYDTHHRIIMDLMMEEN